MTDNGEEAERKKQRVQVSYLGPYLPIASSHAATSDHVAHVADHASALAIARSLLDEVADPRWTNDGRTRLALTRSH